MYIIILIAIILVFMLPMFDQIQSTRKQLEKVKAEVYKEED